MHLRTRIAAVIFSVAMTFSCTRPDGARKPYSGKELFNSCDSCHGVNGEGDSSIKAPRIAGLPAWYVKSQLVKFRTGVRGAHPDDIEGLRMRPMSRQMMNTQEIDIVSGYVETLKAPAAAPTLKGGVAAEGQASYATCTACHGPNGEGNQTLNAPPLAGQSDWYLASQIHKFKAGIRGTNPNDTTGAQMRPMSLTLADDKAVNDVVAHISTLVKQ